jgi:hypothetical protein
MRGVQALRCIAHQNKSFSTNNTEQTLKKDHLLRSDVCVVPCMNSSAPRQATAFKHPLCYVKSEL